MAAVTHSPSFHLSSLSLHPTSYMLGCPDRFTYCASILSLYIYPYVGNYLLYHWMHCICTYRYRYMPLFFLLWYLLFLPHSRPLVLYIETDSVYRPCCLTDVKECVPAELAMLYVRAPRVVGKSASPLRERGEKKNSSAKPDSHLSLNSRKRCFQQSEPMVNK